MKVRNYDILDRVYRDPRRFLSLLGVTTSFDDAIRQAAFGAGEQGGMYYYNDVLGLDQFSTPLFKDSTGTQPVTALTDPVGLNLDRRFNLARGPQLVTNPNFAGGGAGWTAANGAILNEGYVTFNTPSAQVTRAIVLAANVIHEIVFDVRRYNGGTLSVRLGDATQQAIITPVGAGQVSARVAGTGALNTVFARAGAGVNDMDISYVGVRALPGNHRRQSAAASRPTLQSVDGFLALLHDGTDDYQTATIDMTGLDQLTHAIGLRKLSDAATGILLEETGLHWQVLAPDVGATYRWASGGTLATTVTGTPFAAPITNVLIGQASISTDVLVGRVNGVQVGSSAADQGTGDYGNTVWGFGARFDGTAPYNGYEFCTLIRSAIGNAVLRNLIDKWAAGKTGISY